MTMKIQRKLRSDVRSRRGAFLGRCERALWLVGLSCLAWYALACAHSAWYQKQDRRAFDRVVAEISEAEHDRSEWSKERMRKYQQAHKDPIDALARLDIPDADLSVMVLEGTDDWTLNRAVGHIEGTALLGKAGNAGIAGHRDGFFRGLRHLERGDSIKLTTLEGVIDYEVVDLIIVDPDDVEVLDPTPNPTLTLVTCYPFFYVGSAPKRYIVRAQQTRVTPWSAIFVAGSVGEGSAERATGT
jgi:LPXTG-site transpeptidase (sortase) family protein